MRLPLSFPRQVGALYLLMSVLGMTLPQAQADTANLNLTLTIITPPECTLNGSSTMNVSFGDVQQGLIDGSYKRTPINYGLVCTSLASNALKMTLSWTNVTLGGGAAIQTNRSNLGIAVYRDSTRLSNNASLSFTHGSPPALYAVPVKPSGVMLKAGGSFSGVMTLTLDYQ
ncbi:fimbrial protein [Serratia fonticola]|uniref:fimbrial protein n=1 Tax=Serratia fonticola TaxID=47917 RepID=UPI002DB79A5B|nr:fimbrial protein [Serratia fonticola]MEB7886679.1 fimbrial protein [Serratia fonticola]